MIEQVNICVREKNELWGMFQDIIDRAWFSEGKYCQEYLSLIRQHLQREHVFLAPNGTLGLYLALLALRERAPDGGDILVPTFTFYGSATAIHFAGFRPVFVDCSATTFQSELKHFEAARTPNTVGIMPVHIYGQVGEVEEICSWARANGWFSVEDAAQAFGCRKRGRPAGTFADIGVFSTFSDKIYTTGEGAILTTADAALADKIRLIRNQGRPNAGTFTHPELGMNFRLTEFQAALGLHQLRFLDVEMSERRRKYAYYQSKLSGLAQVSTMELISDSTLVPFRFPILSPDRERLKSKLAQAEVQLRDFFVPVHQQPKFSGTHVGALPNAEAISRQGMCLPVHHKITEDTIDVMIAAMQ